MAEVYKGRIAMFEYQPPAVLNQPNPVQNTWYPVLAVTPYCRVYGASVNIEDTDETLEVRATINGEVVDPEGAACTNSTVYHVYNYRNAITRLDMLALIVHSPSNACRLPGFILEGHSILIEVRKTTAAGVGNLTAIVTFGELVDVP